MDFGRKLKVIRLQNKLRQHQIADVLGISRSSYCSYEIGRRDVDLETVLKLSRFYNISVDTLLENDLAECVGEQETYESEPDTRYLSQLSKDEVALILKYRMMSTDEKENLNNYVNKTEK